MYKIKENKIRKADIVKDLGVLYQAIMGMQRAFGAYEEIITRFLEVLVEKSVLSTDDVQKIIHGEKNDKEPGNESKKENNAGGNVVSLSGSTRGAGANK